MNKENKITRQSGTGMIYKIFSKSLREKYWEVIKNNKYY